MISSLLISNDVFRNEGGSFGEIYMGVGPNLEKVL
jgi:hypothetical protein